MSHTECVMDFLDGESDVVLPLIDMAKEEIELSRLWQACISNEITKVKHVKKKINLAGEMKSKIDHSVGKLKAEVVQCGTNLMHLHDWLKVSQANLLTGKENLEHAEHFQDRTALSALIKELQTHVNNSKSKSVQEKPSYPVFEEIRNAGH